MFVGELKSLHQTQGLFNGTTNWEVIDGDLPQDALVIDDEQTPNIEETKRLTCCCNSSC